MVLFEGMKDRYKQRWEEVIHEQRTRIQERVLGGKLFRRFEVVVYLLSEPLDD